MSKITFTCDNQGCTNQKTEYKSRYEVSNKHFCSAPCKIEGLAGVRRVRKPRVDKAVEKKLNAWQRREDFINRWNRMDWRNND